MMTLDKGIFTGNKYKPHFEFWKQSLDALPSGFSFRPCFSAAGSGTRNEHEFLLTEGWDTARRMVGESDTALLVSLLSSLSFLLYYYTGAAHPVITTPLYKVSGGEDIYEEKVPIVLPVRVENTVKEHFDGCQRLIREAYRYQNFPLSLVNMPFDTTGALSNILLVYDGLHCACEQHERYDLVLRVARTGNDVRIRISYRADIFAPSFIAAMAGHLENALNSLGDPESTLQKVDILTPEQQHQLLITFNDTAIPYPRSATMISLFEEQVSRSPGQPAVICGDNQLTYAQLNEQANRVAAYLRETCGVGPGDVVGLLLARSELAIVAMLGVLKSGACYLPVDVNAPGQRNAYIMGDAGVSVLITTSDLVLNMPGDFGGALFAIDVQLPAMTPQHENPAIANTPSDTGYIIYTSGSTGMPKGVMIAHTSNVNMAGDQIRRFGITRDDKVLQFAALSFDASVYEIFMALYAGASLVIATDEVIRNGLHFTDYIREKEVTVATLPPVYLNTLELDALKQLRVLITAGEAPNLSDACYLSRFVTYYNAYGPTECAVCASVYNVSGSETDTGCIPIGKPLSNTQMYILGEDLRLMPAGLVGEICISGTGLAKGYLNQPVLTEEKFVQHPYQPGSRLYRTGDLGRYLPDGNISFLGRKDHQVKIRGQRVELHEISYHLSRYPDLREVAVILQKAHEAASEGELVAFISAHREVDVPAVKAFLGARLPQYMIPARFVVLDRFPVNLNGKIDMHALGDLAVNEPAEEAGYVAPATPTEKRLAEIFARQLGRETIGIRNSFFELGMDSIRMIKILTSLQKEYTDKLVIVDLFTYYTIGQLAVFIDGMINGKPSPQETTLFTTF